MLTASTPQPDPEPTYQYSGGEQYVTKDSGKHAEYSTGMKRDTDEGKPRFDLMLAEGVPFDAQFLTRVGGLLQRGMAKYGARNWEKAATEEELERMKSSAYRHLIQWLSGETDEDHAAAVAVNLIMAEMTKWKMVHLND